jgi:hypothetical protein
MTALHRLKYGFCLAVAVVGVGVAIDIVIRADLGHAIFSPYFVVPVIAVGYFLAPWLVKFIPYERRETK